MPKKRFRPEQIVVILRQIEVIAGQGAPIALASLAAKPPLLAGAAPTASLPLAEKPTMH